jgi:hypothetical protein
MGNSELLIHRTNAKNGYWRLFGMFSTTRVTVFAVFSAKIRKPVQYRRGINCFVRSCFDLIYRYGLVLVGSWDLMLR